MAARLALRGHGRAEPSPLVGCVVTSLQGDLVGWGCHEQCGGPHAEIHALRRAGSRARGATVYLTLEPCNHTGRTGPCTEALIDAGVARVIAAREDLHPQAGGGLRVLRDAGIEAEVIADDAAIRVSDPFVHRVRTGLPWVTVKWAQSLDGKVATRSGESKWISSERSRRMVHRERGRVDVILTGIGTVLRDDPLLTARCVRVRRVAQRVVTDPQLRIPMESRLVATAHDVPVMIACDASMIESDKARLLRKAGVEVLPFDFSGERRLTPLLRDLVLRYDATNVLVEAGPGLMSSLFAQRLVNEAWVFVAPMVMGDAEAPAAVGGFMPGAPSDAARMRLIDVRVRSGDVAARYCPC
jgi:diaminohydroxyphosphoribosylaminopyrimidine deaminase / 5-amino-6-(5-phosphoribosylamino)uracil reductase